MAKYKKIDVTEQQLEDLVRRHTDDIEKGLVYVDHQRPTGGGRLDVLIVDSGKSIVLAELKVVEDDGMLLQGVDYYDFLSSHKESFARLHKDKEIDPTQEVRLFLIAPSFSQTLINRCKWIDIPIALFTYNCLIITGTGDIIPVFAEQAIPSPLKIVEVFHIEDILSYITDPGVRADVNSTIEEIKRWKPERISVDATKDALSMKVDGRVFAYLYPRRKHFLIATYNAENIWSAYPIHGKEDLDNVLPVTNAAMERKTKGA
jgi:hypothetical protein